MALRARGWLLGVGCVASVASVASTSCLDATEIRVDISATSDVCSGHPHTDVLLNETTAPLAQQTDCTASATPNIGSVVVLPKASNDERVEVRVVGTLDSATDVDQCAKDFATPNVDPTKIAKCIEARRSIAFIAHKPLTIPIVLDSACAGVQCPTGKTCESGTCVGEQVSCSADNGKCGNPDAGIVDASPDVTATDAGPDAADAGRPAVPISISARGDTTCVVTGTNHVQCWGDNSNGQMGSMSPASQSTPWQTPLKPLQTIVLGKYHACGIDTSQGLTCWGSNGFGEVTGTPSKTAVGQSTLPYKMFAKHVAVGDHHTCAFGQYGSADGGVSTKVFCWGDSSNLQYSATNGNAPTPIDAASYNTTILAMTAGSNHTCVLANTANQLNGGIVCWGSNNKLYQDGTTPFTPIINGQMPLLNQVILSAGADHTAAGGPTGLMWWGDNTNFVMTGDGTGVPASGSAVALVNKSFTAPELVSVADDHSCASAKGTVTCWGSATSAALGAPPMKTFVNVPLPTGTITGLATGSAHSCAIVRTGSNDVSNQVWCWGDNAAHQLGTTQPVKPYAPVQVNLANE